MSALEQTIPDGYQLTEVGMIPDDWISEPLETFTSFISYGFTNPMPTVDTGPAMITARDIKNGKIQYSLARCTSYEAFNRDLSPKSKPKINDLLLTKDGTLGRLALVDSEDLCINQSVALLRPNKMIVPDFFKLLLESPYYQEKMLDDAGGSTIKHIYITIVNKMILGLPKSLKEQTAIANALSDVDALLSELEKLIAKKQAIKTATMQQLLTGKTRLPQFSIYSDGDRQGQIKGTKSSELGEIPEDWGVLSIGEFSIKVGSGKTPKGGSSVYVDSGRPFVRSQNIGWGQLRLSDLSYITEDIHQTFSGSEIKTDDVLLNITGASIGRCALANQQIEKGNVNQHVCIIRLNSKKVKPYILQALVNSELGQNQIDSYQAGGNREGLNFSQVKNLKFPFSSIPKEQIAIATILSDMDEEIQALKQRLSKTRQIKQGMMQELLTGKTRLPFDKVDTKSQGEPNAD